ncbi:MAG: YHYH protein [Candidatus Obscuribacterales bacterium]|nr:YHYH protein [Candidatus Obscuribacterales bacterium]
MHIRSLLSLSLLVFLCPQKVQAHDLSGDDDHPHYDWSARPPQQNLISQANIRPGAKSPAAPTQNHFTIPAIARPFSKFSNHVRLRWDDNFLYVESNGLPEHNMMVGITAWQQQVPLPQNYFGANAWQIPLHPTPSSSPVSIRDHFLRGAIGLAVNGVPIFNPQNNRGEISQEIGELDQWGGHCGRGDDYHYHAAPLHLQAIVGKDQPIAFALDGYPIYGLTEPDGSQPAGLDAFDGHTSTKLGYHYHASNKYPYVNGGFHGQVTEREGQVDPQPRSNQLRGAGRPLRGATITGFKSAADGSTGSLQYSLDAGHGEINYAKTSDGAWKFQYQQPDGSKTEEAYREGQRANDDRRDGRNRLAQGVQNVQPAREAAPIPRQGPAGPRSNGSMTLRSSVIGSNGDLPKKYSGDGEGISPPLEWSGPPSGTKCVAIIMHHIDREGLTKCYWTLYNIPASTHSLPENVRGVGTAGSNTINPNIGYAPPHSKGPGRKVYTITLYALSAPLQITLPPNQVTRDVLLASMQGKVLASTELQLAYTRDGNSPADQRDPNRPPR